jgi:hypothetical protein
MLERMKGLVVLAVVAGCSSNPVDISGNYTVALTSRDNGCNYPGWTVGGMSTGIPVVITQDGGNATATIGGTAQVLLDSFVGGHTFTGAVDSDSFDLVQHGTQSHTMGNCTYTVTADIVGTLTGDAIAGSVKYTDATNGGTDCATLAGCMSVQDYSGSRPPK